MLGTDEPIIVRFAVRAAFPRFLMLALFAVAMGYLEAAAVLYLRTLYGGIDPVGPRNPPMSPLPDFGAIEIAREAATMAMLAAVGWLAGPRRARFGAFVMAFGMWDLLLRIPVATHRLACFPAGARHLVPDPAAVVGSGHRTCAHRRANGRRRWTGYGQRAWRWPAQLGHSCGLFTLSDCLHAGRDRNASSWPCGCVRG